MKASDLFVKALEAEGVEYIFGIPGEENLDILNSLKNVKVSAVADSEKLIINFIEKTCPDIKVFDNYKTMLENADLDFVFITPPVNSHIQIESNFIKRNLHFFVEKPLSRTTKEW